ncbi:F-box/kelch-repeat protein At3g23880-like [Arachis duranensis]|uniref:F-box/kelch-repeat protein At3g23880-like n=1 Tax=Arachis duranensis TaxID=130453 RepID=A0A9C6WTG7_ARADU|nr:F-box/kelch-repeat protein At3g23880-like [Arachis duranensis]
MEQSSMEKKKLKSINHLLPPELIQAILLRVPIKHLVCVRCVSKLWNTLIPIPISQNPILTSLSHPLIHASSSKTILTLTPLTSTHCFKMIMMALIQRIPFMKNPPSDFHFLGSCRGFVLLHSEPQFLILWNPLTDSSKRISYSHMVNATTSNRDYDCLVKVFCFLHDALLCGFEYDASQDDYVVVVAYKGKHGENHCDLCCLRSNSWINLDPALPKSLYWDYWKPRGCSVTGLFIGLLMSTVLTFLSLIRRKEVSPRYLCQ